MAKILIVDDEPHIARLIEMTLEPLGQPLVLACDGEQAADLLEKQQFDLVLLDVMLPGVDGFALMDYIAPTGTPVIFLTAKNAVADRVRGLKLGAYDYIVKPFAPAELLARVEGLLRHTGRRAATLRVFDAEVDPDNRTVTQNGRAVELTPREFTLLLVLVRARGQALYRDILYERVWGPDAEPNPRALDLHIHRLRKKLANEPGANLFLMAVQDIRVGGRQSNASYQYTLLSDDLSALREWEPKIRKALAALPELADVNSDQQDNGAEMDLVYDRDTMSRLGISVQDANNLLNNAFGQRQISTIYQPLNQYKVVMEVDPAYTQDVSALDKMFVINSDGKPIPLAYFAKWQPANAPLSVNHQGLSAASTISFNLPTGRSLSEASEAIDRAMTQLGVPSSVRGSFAGTAQVFQQTMNAQVILILAAIATVYIVLGVLYESYVHPLTILSTLPSAGVGALLALEIFDAPFSLIALIGIMLLIGIVKKNAIMMVDFALEAQRNGNLTPEEAIFQACLLRFRPIMMTTLAALFGALPLVLSGGDGSELRQPLGITIVGGLVMSQLLTLYTTPVVYLFFDRLRLRFSRHSSQPVSE